MACRPGVIRASVIQRAGIGKRFHQSKSSQQFPSLVARSMWLLRSTRSHKKGQLQKWMDDHPSWKSPATRAGVIAVVKAAFNRAAEMFGVANPIKGLKKPRAEPRLASLTPDDEQAICSAIKAYFEQFLSAAIHTGLRPFCELATIAADDAEEMPRRSMWRVYSSKTKKTRKISVRPEVEELITA